MARPLLCCYLIIVSIVIHVICSTHVIIIRVACGLPGARHRAVFGLPRMRSGSLLRMRTLYLCPLPGYISRRRSANKPF